MHPVRNGRGHLSLSGRSPGATAWGAARRTCGATALLMVRARASGVSVMARNRRRKPGREQRRIAEGLRDLPGVVGRDDLGPRVLARRIRGDLGRCGGAAHDASKRHGLRPEQDAEDQGGAEVAHHGAVAVWDAPARATRAPGSTPAPARGAAGAARTAARGPGWRGPCRDTRLPGDSRRESPSCAPSGRSPRAIGCDRASRVCPGQGARSPARVALSLHSRILGE